MSHHQYIYHELLDDLRTDQACEFLLRDVNFINWYQALDSQQLVIVGDVGVGKTFAMAYLIDELSRRREHWRPRAVICYYYFRAGKPRRLAKIYWILILSLLEQLPGLKGAFVEWYKQAEDSGHLDPEYSTTKLKEFFQLALGTLDRRL